MSCVIFLKTVLFLECSRRIVVVDVVEQLETGRRKIAEVFAAFCEKPT